MYITGTNNCNNITVVKWQSKTHCSQFVKASKELVEQFDQLLSAARRRQLGEAHNVCKQNTARQQDTDRQHISNDIMVLQSHKKFPPRIFSLFQHIILLQIWVTICDSHQSSDYFLSNHCSEVNGMMTGCTPFGCASIPAWYLAAMVGNPTEMEAAHEAAGMSLNLHQVIIKQQQVVEMLWWTLFWCFHRFKWS